MRGNSVVPLEQRLAFVRVTRLSPVQCLNTTQKNGGLVRLFTGMQVLNAEVALSIQYIDSRGLGRLWAGLLEGLRTAHRIYQSHSVLYRGYPGLVRVHSGNLLCK